MRIIVTGGAGFIGSHIVDSYIHDGHSVFIIDNLSTGKEEYINKKATFFKEDIMNIKAMKRIFAIVQPDILNHHAAQINLRKSVVDPVTDAKINILGLINLLESGKRNKIKKVIFASSGGAIYGEAKFLPTPEDYEPKLPLTPYGITKMASEFYVHHYFRQCKIPFTILRYANVYGPRQDPFGEGGVVAIFSKKLLQNESPTINGDGEQKRDFVYVGDVAHANLLTLYKDVNTSVNIATGKETSINKLYQLLKKIVNSHAAALYGAAIVGEQKRSVLANSRARELLKWKPQTALIEGLRKTVQSFAL